MTNNNEDTAQPNWKEFKIKTESDQSATVEIEVLPLYGDGKTWYNMYKGVSPRKMMKKEEK